MQLLDFAKLGGVTEDGADGAEADFRVWTLQEVAEANDGLEGEALEAAFGESGGLALQLGKLAAEVGSWSQRCKVRRPTLERRAAWAMEGAAASMGRADCWRGEGLGFFISGPLRAILSHAPQWRFDRFGRVLLAAYEQGREWSSEGARGKCREFWRKGVF